MRIRSHALVASVILVSLAACRSADDDGAPATTTATTTATTATTTTPTGPSVPAELGAALDDVVAWMADPTTIDPTRFSAELLAEVPADQLVAEFQSIGVGAWGATDVTTDDGLLVAELSGPGPSLVVHLTVDDAGTITGLLFQPAELADPPTTLTGLTARLASSAEITAYLVAEVAPDGTCRATAGLDPERSIPLASAFKLYVLHAVATAIGAGTVSWDQPVTIRDELDSLPSGTTQDDPAGSTLTVRELAQRMIEVSDNTATDHLIDLVGRVAVEATLVDLGHHDPSVTSPIVTTREMFVLKADLDLLGRYAVADVAARRDLLAGEVAAAPLPDPSQFWTEPRAVDTVEWFGSPADICRALVGLSDLSSSPGLEPVGEILSTNPGVPVDPTQFSTVLFKGGSEPGVLFVAWLGTRPDGSRLVVTGGAADTTTPLDPTLIQLLALGLTLR